jgi:transposase
MIQLVPQQRILLAYQPVDFRNGIDGLAALCRRQLEVEPFDGSLFVFRNRRGTALRILCHDGFGYWLITRRLAKGTLRWWPKSQDDARTHPLQAHQLSVLLYNGLPEQASFVTPWRQLPQHSYAASGAAFAFSSSPL